VNLDAGLAAVGPGAHHWELADASGSASCSAIRVSHCSNAATALSSTRPVLLTSM